MGVVQGKDGFHRVSLPGRGLCVAVKIDRMNQLDIRVEDEGDAFGYDPIANVEAGMDNSVAKAIYEALGSVLGLTPST